MSRTSPYEHNLTTGSRLFKNIKLYCYQLNSFSSGHNFFNKSSTHLKIYPERNILKTYLKMIHSRKLCDIIFQFCKIDETLRPNAYVRVEINKRIKNCVEIVTCLLMIIMMMMFVAQATKPERRHITVSIKSLFLLIIKSQF